jgi:hypothetical protein
MEIIDVSSSVVARSLAAALALSLVSSVPAAELVMQKVPPLTVEQAPRYPQNLARFDLGAAVEAEPAAKGSAALALLSNDAKAGFPVGGGKTTLLISLPKIEQVETIAFLNAGAKGSVEIATSSAKLPANSPQWREIARQELSENVISAKVGPGDAKYIRLTFNTTNPGRIAALGVYATPALSDFTMPRSRKIAGGATASSFALVNYNVTDLHTKARALYVSSGEETKLANNMIDDQPTTSYSFSADDRAPATIIDLGRSMPLRRISTLARPSAGTVTFYVLEAVPVGGTPSPAEVNVGGAPNPSAVIAGSPAENAPSTLRLDDGMLAGLKSVGSAADDGSGRVAVDFSETNGRYVMVRWSGVSEGNFTVAEIAAYGRGTESTLLAANRRDGKDSKDFKEARDFKDVPAEGPAEEQPPAEGPPPGLPQPPPFVFIPEVVPTSP